MQGFSGGEVEIVVDGTENIPDGAVIFASTHQGVVDLPMMKIFPGAVQAAKECNVPIIPIAIEQRGKHFLLNVGNELDFTDAEEGVAVQILRDTLATLKWEIWEYLPRENRTEISDDYHEKFVQERLAECAGFTKELVEGRLFRDKTDREVAAIEKDLERLRNKSS